VTLLTHPHIALRRALLALLAITLLAGCTGQIEAAGDVASDADAQAAGATSDAAEADLAADAPVALENCGVEIAVEDPPARAVTMNQAATEVLLSLGLSDRMAGTAYLDDAVLPELAEGYERVPVLAEEYPSLEALLGAEPDLVYGSYASAFRDGAAGERAELAELGIATYLSPAACPETREGAPLTLDDVHAEVLDLGAIFGVPERAAALVAEQRSIVAEARAALASDEPITVLWWDSDTDAPFVGACCGAPAMIMDALGLANVFADVEGSWANVSWEQVVERDPEVVVLVDAEWDPSEDKRAFLAGDAALSGLTAVAEGRFVVLPFSSTTPGVRNAAAIAQLAEDVGALGLR
jgi:iron complex transport system substrate-binding protein